MEDRKITHVLEHFAYFGTKTNSPLFEEGGVEFASHSLAQGLLVN